ncbi:MAG: CvpA family protein [Deltaproteobacteria bacterium]|nr:CvpA family protein [Deltaproteobacteria bacterium]MBW2153211.1 CvpA family protein [Deltaproteobacteria bacterium]
MTLFDLLILNIIVICIFRGLFRGLIKEFFSIIGILSGFYLASKHYQILSEHLACLISTPSYRNIFSFVILSLTVSTLISITGMLITKLSKIEFKKWVNHVVGALLGCVSGILVASVLLVVLTAFLPKVTPLIKHSDLYPYVAPISNKMVLFVSKNMKQVFFYHRSALEEYREQSRSENEQNEASNLLYPDV